MRGLALLLVLLIAAVSGDDSMEDDGGCMTPWGNKGGIFMDRQFIIKIKNSFKSQMFGCLNVTPPMEMSDVDYRIANYTPPINMFTIAKKCMKMAMMEPFNSIKNGKYPNRTELGEAFKLFTLCKSDFSGVNFTNTSNGVDFTDVRYFKALANWNEWSGNATDLALLQKIFNMCIDQRNRSSPYELSISIDKCMVGDIIDYCQSMDRDVGILAPVMSGVLTIADDSPCASVKIPMQVKQYVQDCVDEAQYAARANASKDSMLDTMLTTMSPLFRRPRGKMNMVKELMKGFFKNIVMNSTGCVGEKMGFYNSTADSYDADASVYFMGNLTGWASNDLKQSVIDIFKNCSGGKIDYYNDEGKNEKERMMNFWNMKKEFEVCFTPKFANVCGINNDLYSLFHPFLNEDVMEIYMKAFMEYGGQKAIKVLDMLKKGMEMVTGGM